MPPRISFVHQFEQQQRETGDLAFSQDGKQLVSSDGKALYLWRLKEDGNWGYERSHPFQNAGILHCARDVTFCVQGEAVKLISFDGREITTFPRPPSRFWQITPDLRWVVSSEREHILLWDLVSSQDAPIRISIPFPAGRKGVITDWPGEPVLRFLFTPDCRQVILFAGSPEGSLQICSFDPEHKHITLQKTLPGMIDGTISPDGKMLAIILYNEQIYAPKEEIYVYHLESLRLLQMFPQTTKARYSLLAFSPDCQYLMGGKTDGLVDVFSLASFDCVTQFAAHPGLSSHATDPIGGLDWSKTGYIATGGASEFEKNMNKTDYTIKIWRVEEQ